MIGRTKVAVFKLKLTYVEHSLENGQTVQVPKIDYDNAERVTEENLNNEKWTGAKPFTIADSGWYELRYYWRLDDGRYLSDTKIVVIRGASYTAEIETQVNNKDAKTVPTIVPDMIEGTADQSLLTFNGDNVATSMDDNQTIVKSKEIKDFSGEEVLFGWKNDGNYKLVDIIIEASQDGFNWTPLTLTLNNPDNPYDFIDAEYTYYYQDYRMVQNPSTNQYYVIEENEPQAITSTIVPIRKGENTDYADFLHIRFEIKGEYENVKSVKSNIRVKAVFVPIDTHVVAQKFVNKQNVLTGEEVEYTVHFTPDNFNDAYDVKASDVMPQHTEYVNDSVELGEYVDGKYVKYEDDSQSSSSFDEDTKTLHWTYKKMEYGKVYYAKFRVKATGRVNTAIQDFLKIDNIVNFTYRKSEFGKPVDGEPSKAATFIIIAGERVYLTVNKIVTTEGAPDEKFTMKATLTKDGKPYNNYKWYIDYELVDSNSDSVEISEEQTAMFVGTDELDGASYLIEEDKTKMPENFYFSSITNNGTGVFEDGTVHAINVRNYYRLPEGMANVFIEKRNSKTDDYVPGAKMKLEKLVDGDNYQEVTKWETDSERKTILLREVGKYRVVEEESPERYFLNSEPVYFEVQENTDGNLEILNDEGIIVKSNVIKFYNEPRVYSRYKVEYYYDGNIAIEKTENFEAEIGTQINSHTDNLIPGYRLKSHNVPIIISEDETQNIIRVYYVKRTDLIYKVNFLEDGTNRVLNPPTVVKNATYMDVINAEEVKIEIPDYEYVRADPESITVDVTEKELNLYYKKKIGKVVIKYLEKGSEDQLHEPDEIENEVGERYDVSDKKLDIDDYIFAEVQGNVEGKIIDGTIEVIFYYYYNVPELTDTVMEKDGTNSISNKNDKVSYTIEYSTKIINFVGDATLTIIDTLPYHIDEKASTLNDGKYDPDANTITWTQEITGINSYENKNNTININKKIEVVYTDLDLSETEIVNEAIVKLYFKKVDKTEESTDDATTLLDFMIDIPVTKIWNDSHNKDLQRPDMLDIILKKNGADFRTYTLSDEDKSDENDDVWEYVFSGLPKYDENGDEISYSIDEREKELNDLKYYSKSISGDDVEKGITITNTIHYAKVIVHHYILNSHTRVPSVKGGTVDDVIIQGNIGDDYNTSKSDEVSPNYEFVKTEGNVKGQMTENAIEVTYYYQLKTPTIDASATKKGTEEIITEKDSVVLYTLHYSATIEDYIGDATLTLVDKLPYHIDKDASDIQQGDYDEQSNTITWKQELVGINSYEKINNTIDIYKNLKLVFKDIDLSKENMTNKFDATLHLKTPDKTDKKTDEESTKLDFTIDIPVEKVWVDSDDVNEIRPKEINLILKENGKEKKTVTIGEKNVDKNDNNKWKYTFKDLPKYDESREKIDYTVEEKAVKHYTSQTSGNIEDGITITNSTDYAKVIVHHYLFGTKEKVPAKGGGVVQDEKIEGKVDKEYTTEVSNKVSPNYEFIASEGQLKGKMTANPIEVTYYYKLKDPKVTQTDVIKESATKITKKTDKVPYTITYVAVVDEYIGDATVTIVDKLPYQIDEEKSELADGKYDAKNKTITWVEKINGIDSYEGKNNIINIKKKINLVYKDIDVTQEEMENNVSATLDLLKTKTQYEDEDNAKTEIDVNGEVIVKYKDRVTNKEIDKSVTETGKIGKKFDVSKDKKEISGYTLVDEPKEKTGKFKEEKQEKIYYYAKNTDVHVRYVDKLTKDEIEKDVLIEGYEGKSYETKQKEIENFKFVESTKNIKGKMTSNRIEVVYYYIRAAKVIVKYVEKDSGKELAKQEEIKGYQDDKYKTEQKNVQFYNLLETPKNAQGNMRVTMNVDKDGKKTIENTTYVTYYFEKKKFNLNIEKIIKSVILNGNEIAVNNDLGKVELYRKSVNSDKLEIVYLIKVTNDSELTGKAQIRENIPDGLIMESQRNPEWTIKNDIATLQTDNIKPGEEREYTVRLTWKSNSNNIGQKQNTAQIVETQNEANFEEYLNDDNTDSSDVIIAIGTGKGTAYEMAIGFGIIAIMLFGLISIIKWQREKEDK